jgi:hypothetical protein
LYVRFSFTTGASQEATQAASTTWDLRFISRDAKRDESKLAGKKLAPHALDLPSKVPDVQAQRQSEQRHLITSKVSGSNRRSSVLPPFQLCVDEVPHAVLDGKLEQRMHSLHLDIKPATIARVQELLAHVLTELKAASQGTEAALVVQTQSPLSVEEWRPTPGVQVKQTMSTRRAEREALYQQVVLCPVKSYPL